MSQGAVNPIDVLKEHLRHKEALIRLATERIDILGKYNIAIAEARVKQAEAEGIFLDNQRKAWSLQKLKTLHNTFEEQVAIAKRDLRRQATRWRRAYRLIDGDQMTEDAGQAWLSLHQLIRNAPADAKDQLAAQGWNPECGKRQYFVLVGHASSHKNPPFNEKIELRSLKVLAYRLQYYQFAPRVGSPPHELVVDGLKILMAPSGIAIEKAEQRLKDARVAFTALTQKIADGAKATDLPDPEKIPKVDTQIEK